MKFIIVPGATDDVLLIISQKGWVTKKLYHPTMVWTSKDKLQWTFSSKLSKS
jgi:hypothetical protein